MSKQMKTDLITTVNGMNATLATGAATALMVVCMEHQWHVAAVAIATWAIFNSVVAGVTMLHME